MPVDVPVALLTSQTHHVQTFSRNGASDRFANAIHPALQNCIFVLRQVASDLFDMLPRADEHVSLDGWVAIKKDHDLVVLINELVVGALHRIARGE